MLGSILNKLKVAHNMCGSFTTYEINYNHRYKIAILGFHGALRNEFAITSVSMAADLDAFFFVGKPTIIAFKDHYHIVNLP